MSASLFTEPHILSRFYAYKNAVKKPSFWSPKSGLKSFEDITGDVERVRSLLAELKIGKSEPCLLLFHFSYEFLVLLFALLAEGSVPVLIDPRLSRLKWRKLAKTANVKYIFISEKTKLARLFFFTSPGITFFNTDKLFSKKPISKPLAKLSLEDPVLLSFTSGTTGDSKIVSRSLGVLGSQQTLFCKYLSNLNEESHLAMHGIGVIQSLIQGSPTFFLPAENLTSESLYTTITTHSVSTLSTTPGALNELLIYLENSKLKIQSLKYLVTGGAPIPKWLVTKSIEKCPNALFINVYASTESEPISLIGFTNSENTDLKFTALPLKSYPDSLGYPVGKIIEELEYDRKNISNAYGKQFFELTVRGQNCVSNSPSGFVTGDILYQENGLFFYCGRNKEQLGIYPSGLAEDYLERIPAIKRAATKLTKAKLKVYLELHPNQTVTVSEKEEIIGKLKELLDHAGKIEIIKLPKIPVDPRHLWKIQKKKL